jgi:beta-lactamase superfamily II metal-dependent hydrolase
MQIEIFDVGHGHCSVMTAPNGSRLMLDCGTKWGEHEFWTPSLHYYKQTVAALAPLNLDEDHIKDFGEVLKDCDVRLVITNPSIGPDEFRRLKAAPLAVGAQAYLRWLNAPKSVGIPESVDFRPVEVRWYWNRYGGECKTTNDLSLAVVCQFGHFKILFAGDLEANGWCGLLRLREFVEDLRGINVFVASHHGRRSGCHDDVFKFMKPAIVVISDDEKQHETQETDAWYRARCYGVPLIADPQKRRHVLTTRSDGSMRINASADGAWKMHWGVPVKRWPTRPMLRSSAPLSGSNILTSALLGGALGLSDARDPRTLLEREC